MHNFGSCPFCGNQLKPVMFLEEEDKLLNNHWVKTGRQRMACSYLICDCCGKKILPDGEAFSSGWTQKK